MRIHPACALFPDIPTDEYKELVADIKANGCHVPIVLYNGAILDGRHRQKACHELKIDCPTENWKPKKGQSATKYVVSLNLRRRHLPAKQRAALGIESLSLIQAENKAAGIVSNETNTDSLGQVAQMAGVSRATAGRAAKVRREDPKAHEAAKRGEKPKKSSGSSPAKKSTDPPARRTKFEQAVAAKDPLLRIAGFVVQIRKLVKQIESKPIGAHFHAQQAITDLKNLERNAKFALPFKACPICGGYRGCKHCNKSGFVPKDVYERWEASQK